MPTRILYWFRNDLHLHDNEAFSKAVGRADEIIPVYVFDKRKFEPGKLGFHKTGRERARFLRAAVEALRDRIRAKGGELLIRTGEPEKVIADLANQLTVQEVHTSKEITLDETNVESSLSKRLKILNVDLELTWMNTLFHPHDLPFYISRLPVNFGTYCLALQPNWHIRTPVSEPEELNVPAGLSADVLPSLAELGFGPAAPAETHSPAMSFMPEPELLAFLKQETATKGEVLFRINTGAVSPRVAYHLTPAARPALLPPLLWRDYMLFTTLRYGSRVFKPSGIGHNINREWRTDTELFHRWRTGDTSDESINALMKKFLAAGYLTFQETRIVAEYLARNLEVDWTWGAHWFESNLISYDVAYTWGNWNFFAGVGSGCEPVPDFDA